MLAVAQELVELAVRPVPAVPVVLAVLAVPEEAMAQVAAEELQGTVPAATMEELAATEEALAATVRVFFVLTHWFSTHRSVATVF